LEEFISLSEQETHFSRIVIGIADSGQSLVGQQIGL
jgi:hypothetical protein